MSRIDVRRSTRIEREATIVRRQFGDVAHHERSGVHRGVRFEVLNEDAESCRYLQITHLGPLRLRQEFMLPRTDDGPLVNEVIAGQFAGGTITFTITPSPDSVAASDVEARLNAELTGMQAPLAPILRRVIPRALATALQEDKEDLEHGGYPADTPE